MATDRVKKIYVNTGFAIATNILMSLLAFVTRKIFIDTLGMGYQGYNSVFTNLLQLLSMADLGVGTAITSYLYKPLARGNYEEIASLMQLYKKIYHVLGILVIAIGLVQTALLPWIIKDADCSDGYLRFLFLLNLITIACSYFFAYKSTLLIADQKNYLVNIINFAFNLISTIIKIVVLIVYPNYVLFLVIGIASTVINNVSISIYVDKKYSFLPKPNVDIINSYKKKIFDYVKDIFIAKIGAYIYSGTDNVIISMFIGSLASGYLSTYTMLTTMVNSLVKGAFSSVQATFGNYIRSVDDKKLQKNMTDNYLMVNFVIGNFCFLCFFFLCQPFISIIFGDQYLLEISTPFWLGVNLLLTIMLVIPSQIFVIYRLYNYDKWIVAVSAIGNILISVALVNIIGLNGVLIGTFVTSLIYLVSRFYIISQKVYEISYFYYIKKFGGYALVTAISFAAEYAVAKVIKCATIIQFLGNMVIVVAIALTVPLILLCTTSEFKFVMETFLPKSIKTILFKKK